MPVDEPYCACHNGYFGSSCAHRCYNGNITMDADGEEFCDCDPCYNLDDIECNTECSGHGSCHNSTCDCGTDGWRGDYCQKPGCPGTAGSSGLGCSDHGSCLDNIGQIGTCQCDAFWFGLGCDVAICLNNCSGNGTCNSDNDVPFCECNAGYMTGDCSVYCYGDVIDGECVCRTNCEDPSDNCEKTCNDIGTCVDGQCQCYNETGYNTLGYWGDRCTDQTCPGYLEACSGHGFCANGVCTCIDQGWLGDWCHLPDCPGYPVDCNGVGSCNITSDPPSCNCYDGYMGAACDSECVNGDPNADGSECICHSCFTVGSCSETCSGRGTCFNDTCLCQSGWWGDTCTVQGCPGIGTSCSGHGLCTPGTQVCTCDSNWQGEGCDEPKCAGDPYQCNGKGECACLNETYIVGECDDAHALRWCINCTDSMGPGCEYPCIHGTITDPPTVQCHCDSCYDDEACSVLCGGHGNCSNTTCVCEEGYKGDYCRELDCPGEPDCTDRGTCVRENGASICKCQVGFADDDCSQLVCQGQPMCSDHGDCILTEEFAFPICVCYHGFTEDDCSLCETNFAGDNCDRCKTDYIGYNTTCSTFCVNGQPTELGGAICQCYYDDEHGHWDGNDTGCVECFYGWNLPDCKKCAAHFVGPDCNIPCVDNQGQFIDPNDGSDVRHPVLPVFACVEQIGSTYTAWFGYINNNTNNIYLAGTGENTMIGINYTVPVTKFEPRDVTYAFPVGPLTEAEVMSGTIGWRLSNTKHNIIHTAYVSDSLCSGTPEQYLPQEVEGHCGCFHGYHGSDCSISCVGGSDNPCYGKGICDTTHGTCSCYDSSNMTSDCSSCNTGWSGEDCSVADTGLLPVNTSWYLAQAYSSGHFITYDGSVYEFNGVGEYLLTEFTTRANHETVTVNIVQVPSSSITAAASVYAVGIKVGSNTLVIRADACGTEGFTWLNDEEIAVGFSTELGSDVSCKQMLTRQYRCSVDSEFNLIVDTYAGHLAVQAWSDNCNQAEGLFGRCDGDGATNDFISASGSALDPGNDLNVTNIYAFATSWQASTETSMFTMILPNAIPSTAEMCLRSKAGHAISDSVYSFTQAEVSIEIKFYLETVEAECATLWSYKSERTFSLLICDEYVSIYFDNEKTEIKALNRIRSQTWYHLATVWDDDALELEFFLAYYIADSQSYELASATLDQSPLIPGGKFMLGQMHYDSSMNLAVMGWSFDGYFDEFTIWKKKIDLEFVIRNAFAFKAGTEDGLSSLWRFNEGQGTVSVDSLSQELKMQWVSGPRAHPEWAVCGYTMEYPVMTHHVLSDVLSTYQDEAVQTKCTKLMEKTGLRETLTNAAWLKFYQQCLFNIYAGGDEVFALEVLVALSDAQMVEESDKISDMRSYRSWPGRMLCSEFTDFHGWSGESCDVFCLAGDYDTNTGDCICAHGFWNISCNQICPYARNSVCGRGTCINGDCICTGDRYDASTGCKQCSSGWSGADCSTAVADVSGAAKRMGTSFSLGHTIMFDGQGYDINTPGQYVLMEMTNVGLYVRMKPVGSNVVIQQLWMQVSDEQFTIQTPLLDDQPLIFWHNLEEVQVVNLYTITGSITISWEDQTNMKIDLTSYSNLVVIVRYLGSYLDLEVVFESSSCPGGVTGLLGNCDNNIDNDFYSTDSNVVTHYDITQDIIDSGFVNKFTRADNFGFIYTYPGLSITEPESMASGYSLFFNQWGIMSAPLPSSVFDGSKDTTFDIKIKVSSINGLILGYSAGSKFSILVENLQLKLWANGQKYATNFIFTQDEWTHLFVSHDMSSGTVTVTIFIDSLLNYQEMLTVPNMVFNSGGSFVLGYWQVQPPASFGKLIGMIGTLRVWDKVLADYVMYDASITQIIPGYENLVILYEFTEGMGLTSYDSVSDVGVTMPRTGEVTWFITDMPQVPKAQEECPSTTSTSEDTSDSDNREICTETLQSETLQSVCADLGVDFVSSYFFDACLTDPSYISSLKALVDECVTIVDPEVNPVTDICTDGTDSHYQTVCTEFCKFGTPSELGCKCNDGYWGETCDRVCPGGSDNPCYGHGICDLVTGHCGCYQGFSELHNCSQCEEMYMEPDCEIRYPPSYNSTENVVDTSKEPVIKSCVMSSIGRVINFMEISFDFKHIGQFYLVKPDSENDQVPDIQVSTTSCYTSRACITSLHLAYKSDTIHVQGASSSSGDIIITLNEVKKYTSTVITGLQYLEVDNTGLNTYWFNSLDGELKVSISHSSTDARYLHVSIYMLDSSNCLKEGESICGSCSDYTLETPVTSYNESWDVPGIPGDSGGSGGSGGTTTESPGGSGGSGGSGNTTTESPGGSGGSGGNGGTGNTTTESPGGSGGSGGNGGTGNTTTESPGGSGGSGGSGGTGNTTTESPGGSGGSGGSGNATTESPGGSEGSGGKGGSGGSGNTTTVNPGGSGSITTGSSGESRGSGGSTGSGGSGGSTAESPGGSGGDGGSDDDEYEDNGGPSGSGGSGGWDLKFKDTGPGGDEGPGDQGYPTTTSAIETTTAGSGGSGGSGSGGPGGSTTQSSGGSGGSTTESPGGSGGSGGLTTASSGGSSGSGSGGSTNGGSDGSDGSTTSSSGGSGSSSGGDGSTTVGPGSGGSDSECPGESSSLGTSDSEYESRVSTRILKGIFTNEKSLTLSFKMKVESGVGTILTYTHETVFHVYLEYTTLKFSVGNDIFNSAIQIPLKEWVHLSLVWSHVTLQMIVYSTPMESGTGTENYLLTVPKVAFNNYGILTLGSFNPPFDPCVVDPIKRHFIGEIDEFFLLDTALEASEEADYRNDSVSLDDEKLKLYYSFDKVDNYVIPDLVAGNDLIVDTPPWKEPAVVFPPSDVPVTPPPTEDDDEAVDSTDGLIDAEAECNKYFNNTDMKELCGDLVNIDMYWDSCIAMMEATGESSTALDTALQYAEACSFLLEMEKDSSGSGGSSTTTQSPGSGGSGNGTTSGSGGSGPGSGSGGSGDSGSNTTTESPGSGVSGNGTTSGSGGSGGSGGNSTTESSGSGGSGSGTTSGSGGSGGSGGNSTTESPGSGGSGSGTTSSSGGSGGSGGTTTGSSGSSGSGSSGGTTTASPGGSGSGGSGGTAGSGGSGDDGTINPMQFLCHEDPVATGYVGALCEIPCKYPDPEGNGLLCVCADGYWGVECDHICPGGAESPCNGNGDCDQTSGLCTCSSNFQGDSCSECAPDWVGSDCQLIVQDKVPGAVSDFYSCSLTSDKHLGTFDGAYLSLETREDGVFVMYLDSSLKVDIQIGPCSMYPKCVLAVGFAAGGNIATVIPQNTGVVKLNGEQVMIQDKISLSSSYSLTNPSTGKFCLAGPNEFSVDVSVQPSFLNIYTSSKTCPDASINVGICSGCGQQGTGSCALDDLLCLMNTVGIVDTVSVNETIDQDTIIEYFDQYHIEYKDSVFAAANETQITTGYAIKLGTEDSYISFPPFGPDVFSEGGSKSVEMRLAFESADGGTVFSYATENKTFGVVIENGKFVVQYGTDTYPTGIDVKLGEWCNVGISYDEDTGEVLFDYIHGESGIHKYAIIDDIGPGALDVDGTLTVGQWNGITTNVTSSPPPGSSEMLVDRVLIWDKGLSPNNFKSNWDVNKISKEDGLASIYNMDEGTGLETKDSLTDNVATIDPDSFWIQSDADIIPGSGQVGGDMSGPVINNPVAEQVCTDLKESLQEECGSLTALLNNMYKTCYDDVSKTGNPDDSMDSALFASTECSKQLDIDEPLQSSCNDFPSRSFPGWVGDMCDTQCLHGTFSTELGCECNEGYYGSTCSEVCPGGPVPPCSGHGTCQNDGTCLCEPNWAGDSICSSCANNYSPPNCDELQVQPADTCSRTQCNLNKGGKIVRMDCTKKTHDETGDLVLLAYGSLKITARQTTCITSKGKEFLCPDKLTIKDDVDVSFFFKTKARKGGKQRSKAFINGQKWNKKTKSKTIGSISLTMVNRKSIEVSHPGTGLLLIVKKLAGYFIVTIEVSRNVSDGSTGLCQSIVITPERGSADLSATMISDANVNFGDPDLQDTTIIDGLAAGRTACFKASTLNLDMKPMYTKKSSFTIELYVKTCTAPVCYGVIWSYATTKTFAIWNKGTVVITFDDWTWDTGAELEDNKWNQISIVWTKKRSKLEAYVFHSNGMISKYATPTAFGQSVVLTPNPFAPKGKLSLGRWQPARDDTGEHTNDAFVGCMDELRIWNREFQLVEMQGHWDQHITSQENNLIGYWKFDKISVDDKFLDLVSRNIGFPVAGPPFSTISLVASDCPITYISTGSVSRRRRDVRNTIGHHSLATRPKREVATYDISICDSLFSTSSMATICSSLTSTLSEYYFDCINAGDDDEITNTVVEFGSECELMLNLSTSPLVDMCAEYEDEINFWETMGDSCEPECNFGTRESSATCNCEDGYWGPSCDYICPGGATEPCSGFGTCDQSTGRCDCPINRLSSPDCSDCAWYGLGCEFAENEANNDTSQTLAIAGRMGHVYTLDGLSYTNRDTGEYVLLAVSSNIIIEGKFVTCYQNYTCLPFIAARIGDDSNGYATVTVQARRTYNSKPRVYINDIETVLDTPAYFNGFSVSRTSFLEISFEVTSHFSFQIRVEGQYLQLTVEMPVSLISGTAGFLSGNDSTTASEKIGHLFEGDTPAFDICESMASTQTELGSSSSTTLTLVPYNQTSTSNSELDMTRFAVSECDSFIFYPTTAEKVHLMGGYNLNFEKASVYSDITLDVSTYPNITFEMMVRQSGNVSGGLLFSFTNQLAFMVISGDTCLEVHTYIEENLTVVETNITLQGGRWNTLIFTYYSESGAVEIFRLTEEGAISKKEFIVSSWLFNSTGTLSLGHWRPPRNGYAYLEPPAFTGEMDNFMVWNLPVEGSQTYDLYQMDPALASGSLLYNFQFDEGDGVSTVDYIGYGTAYLPQYPWVAPAWLPSDLVYTSVNEPAIDYVYFYNSTLEQLAEEFCSENLLPGVSSVDFLGITNDTREFFYLNCLQAVAATGDTTAGYNAILELYKIGEISHGMASSVSSDLCSQLSVEELNGTTCTISCQFGFSDGSGGCICARGYFGNQCDSVCPGDSDNPCSNHGDCESDGTCSCWWNWQGDSECSSCSSYITGTNCTVLDTSTLSSGSKKVAAVSSNGYYMTFGGQQISFIGETGAFMLFSSGDLNIDVHVYQVSCHYGSCIAAVSVSTSTSSVVVTPAGQGYKPRFYQDGVEIFLEDTTVVFDSSLSIDQLSLTEMEITATAIGSIEIHILVQEQFLQASVVTSSTVCQDGNGIFDICSGGAKDYSAMSVDEISAYIVSNFKLNDSIILTALNSPAGSAATISGYALKFNGTAAVSVPLTYTSSNISLVDRDFSMSLYFKPTAVGGYILSYAKNVTFSILNTQPLSLQYDSSTINTIVNPLLNEWNQIILTFRQSTNQIDFFHFSESNSVTHEILDFECPYVFSEDGIIMLGEWVPSTGSDAYLFNKRFEGLIDDISIWKDPIENSLIYQAHKLDVKKSGFTEAVTSLFTFSEGVGATSYEIINGNNLDLPRSPWQTPEWEISDLPLSQLRTVTSNVYTASVGAEVDSVCAQFFENAAAASNCGGIGANLRWWYQQMCRFTAANSGDISDTTFAMADYTSLCGVTGGTTAPLYTLICGLNITLPDWLSQKCSDCHFGYKASDGTCICYYGYWGTSCDGVCKGGAALPCNGNGVCDTSGECQCYGRFNGDACEASTCQTDWTGSDCTILSTSFTPLTSGAEVLVAQVNLIGQLSFFDGTIVDMPERGYYSLMNVSSADVSIIGRFGICETASALHVCLIGMVLRHGGQTYYISYEGYTGSSIEIETANETLHLYSSLALGNANLELESQTTMIMTFSHLDLTLKLSAINSRLLLTLSTTNATWISLSSEIDGALASCDTAKAITAAQCSISRSDLCANTSQTIPADCVMSQTADALSAYLNKHLYINTVFQEIIDVKYLAAMEANCLKFNATGVSVMELTLPDGDFTIELQVHPTQYGGIVMDYAADLVTKYFILINTDTGLLVVLDGVYYTTGLIMELDEWNQIALAWRSDVEIMEVYLTNSTGKTSVKAVLVPGSVFVSGGTLTLGTLTPDLDVAIAMGDFVGYIDEARIWSRPHNPTIITQNWRVVIKDDTADVSHSWTFNEGTGLFAYEEKRGEHFVVDNALHPPTWSKSDLDLASDAHLKAPVMTTELPISLAALEAAIENCTNLIDAFSLSTGSSDIDDIVSAFEALCVQELTETNDSVQADAVLASLGELYQAVNNETETPLANMCNDLLSISDYIGYSGDNCTECVFGTVTSDGECECFDTHWGTSCENVCPVGPLGACNTYGVCNSTAGHCECFSRFSGSGTSAVQYWSDFITSGTTSVIANYSCQTCADGWVGSDCSFAKASGTSTTTYVAFAEGAYITTLDGISITLIVPGVYELLKTNNVEVQALFVPCQGSHTCRYLQEIAFKDSQSVINIQFVEDGNFTILHDGEIQEYPTSESSSALTLDWSYMYEYPRIKFGGSSVLVYYTTQGLVSNFKVSSSDARGSSGLLGNSDGDWVSDFNCETQTGTQIDDENLMSGDYAGECIHNRYRPAADDVFIQHDQGKDSLTSAGYMLHLENQTLSLSDYPVKSDLSELTLGFWTKSVSSDVSKRSISSFSLLQTNTGSHDLEFLVGNHGELQISWDQLYETDISFSSNTWTYLALSWSDDGSWNVYIITEDETHVYTGPTALVGEVINLGNMTVTGSSDRPIQTDYIRAWCDKKTLEDVVTDMQSYSVEYSPGLLMTVPLDEGTGSTPVILTYSSNGTTTSTLGNIIGTNTSLWQAATVPVRDIYQPDTLRTDRGRSNSHRSRRDTSSDYTQAATSCLEVLNEGNLTEHCGDMGSSLKDYFLEACIRDYDTMESQSTDFMLSVLVFYCQAALDVDECTLAGFLDFCPPVPVEEEASMMILIFAAAGAGLLLLILLIIIIICCKKKQKKKKQVEGMLDQEGFSLWDANAYANPAAESETSFSDGHRPSSSFSGRQSISSSIGSSLFDSQNFIGGAPPDRFTYADRGRMSMTGSRRSGSMSAIDIMVSPTPEPADNRNVTQSAFSRGRIASSPGLAPTPSEFSNAPTPLGTGVMRKRPSMPIIRPGAETPVPRIPPPRRNSSALSMGDAPKAPWTQEGRDGISPTPTPGNLSVKILWNSLVSSRMENTPDPSSPGPSSPGPLTPDPIPEEEFFASQQTSEV